MGCVQRINGDFYAWIEDDAINLCFGKYGYGVSESCQDKDMEYLFDACIVFNELNNGYKAKRERGDKSIYVKITKI